MGRNDGQNTPLTRGITIHGSHMYHRLWFYAWLALARLRT
jgi:hypothetical protein